MTSGAYDDVVELAGLASRSVGAATTVELTCDVAYPPYEGGPLPTWMRDAGHPARDVGARCLALVQALLGPIEAIDADWTSTGRDPNLAFDDWKLVVRCARGRGTVQIRCGGTPDAQVVVHGAEGMFRGDASVVLADAMTPPLAQRLRRSLSRSLLELRSRTGRASTAQTSAVVIDAAEVERWAQKVARAAEQDHDKRLAATPLSERVPFLVTGATGNLGRATVKRLRERGHRVRVMVRRMPEHPLDGIEYCVGNLGDPDAVDRAVKGAERVIHAGAAMKGGWTEHRVGTVLATQNVLDACTKHGVKQLVHISSMSVIDWAGSSGNGAVSEATALEPRPDARGAYTRAKLEAEKLVVDAAARGLPCVILRPGQIFGGGIPLINGAVARNAAGRWLVLGDGKLTLPLVYIDDVVDAIVSAVDKQLVGGEIIQIIDPDPLTQDDVLGLAGGNKPVVRVPRPLVFALGKLSEVPLGALGKQSPVGVYRLKSALARLHYDSDRAQTLLGWTPRVGVREGIRRVV